jgi:hypothetical protein
MHAAVHAFEEQDMKLPDIAISLALACSIPSVFAYTIKTYHGQGASRVQACSLARLTARSPDEEPAHGRLLKVSACQCAFDSQSPHASGWQCLVQATHER